MTRKEKRIVCPRCGKEGSLRLKMARGWQWQEYTVKKVALCRTRTMGRRVGSI